MATNAAQSETSLAQDETPTAQDETSSAQDETPSAQDKTPAEDEKSEDEKSADQDEAPEASATSVEENSKMRDKDISAKLYSYLVGNNTEKFDIFAAHSLQGKNLKSKARYVFHRWTENPLKMPLLLAAVYYKNYKIVEIMLKYKNIFNINEESTKSKETALFMLGELI